MPPNPDMTTSFFPLAPRAYIGSDREVILVDSNNSFIPVDGFVSKWLFYAKEAGRAAFQVWRRREDLGTRK